MDEYKGRKEIRVLFRVSRVAEKREKKRKEKKIVGAVRADAGGAGVGEQVNRRGNVGGAEIQEAGAGKAGAVGEGAGVRRYEASVGEIVLRRVTDGGE